MKRKSILGTIPPHSVFTYLALTLALLIPLAAAGGKGALAGQTQRVELASKRTEHSRTFLNSDGTLSTEISVLPVSYTDEAGRLKPVDTALVADSDGYKAAKNSLSVDFGSRAGNLFKLTKKDEADIEVTAGAAGSLEETMTPTKDGPSHLTYKTYKKGAKLSYRVLPGRLKEEITISAPTTDTVFSFDLTLKNLTPVRRRGGSVALENPAGKTSLTIEAPFMMDQNSIYGTPDTYSSYDIEMTLQHKQDSLYTLTLVPSTAWLTDPTRVYPVVIDPTFTVPDTPSQDTWIWAGDPDHPHPTWYRMLVGGWSPTNQTKSLVKFDLSSIPKDAQVSSATLGLTHVPMTESNINSGEYGTGNTYTRVYRVTQGWDDDTATWAASSYYHPTVLDQKTVDDPNFSVLDLVRNWVKGVNDNYGFMLDNSSEVQLLNNTYPGGTLDPDPWSWTTSNPHSADKAHREPNASGYHRHLYQSGPGFFIPKNSQIRTWVYPSGVTPTDEVMLQFKVGSWEHRAYWGANSISLGTNGTDSRRYTGSLPASGGWRDIWVKSTDVGIDDTNITGMAFSLYNGYAVFDEVSNWRTQNFYTMEAGSGNPTLTLIYTLTRLGKEPWRAYKDYSGVEVDLQTGNLMVENTDVAIPGRGLGTTFSRTYNSQDASASVFGLGWRSYPDSVRVTSDSSSAAVYTDSGAVHHYLKTGPAYIRPPGVTDDLTKNADGTFVLKHKDTAKTNFDSAGRISSEVDRNGNTVTFAYGANGHIQNITDPTGRRTTVSYSAQNTVSQISDFAGRTVSYGYDGSGRLASFTNQATQTAETVTYTYNASGVLSGVTDPEQHSTSVSYDAEKRATGVSNPLGNTMAVSYNTQNVPDETDTPRKEAGKTTVTDPRGYSTTYYFTPEGLVTKVVEPMGQSPDPTTNETDFPNDEIVEAVALDEYADFTSDMTAEGLVPLAPYDPSSGGATTKYEYDSNYNQTETTDKNGLSTTYTYDSKGNVLTEADDNGTTAYEYDAKGNLAKETTPSGEVRRNTYDTTGNVLASSDHEGNTTSYSYNGRGETIAQTEPKGNEPGGAGHYLTTYSYDANGNLVAATDPMGVTAETTPNALGLKVSERREGLGETKFYYDAMGRIRAEIGPPITQGSTTVQHKYQFYYDKAGRKTKAETYEGNGSGFTLRNWVDYTYDAAGQLVSQTESSGAQTTYTYDTNGNKISETSPLGGVTSYEYDALSRLTKETSPDGTFTAYKYDAVGNVVKEGTSKGTTVNTYDKYGETLAIADANLGVSKSYYDEEGRETRTSDALHNNTTISYDGTNEVTTILDAARHTTTYSYDANGNRVEVVAPGNARTDTDHNEADQIAAETDQNHQVSTTTYNTSGLESSVIEPNRKNMSLAYDQAGNPIVIAARGDLTAGSNVAIRYNGFGSPVTMTTTDSAGNIKTQVNTTYDAYGRVESTTDLSGTTISYDYDLAQKSLAVSEATNTIVHIYDTAGNLKTVTDPKNRTTTLAYDSGGQPEKTSLPNGVESDADYDAVAQLTHLAYRHGSQAIAYYDYAYDKNGNIVGTTSYASGLNRHDVFTDGFATFNASSWTDQSAFVHHDATVGYMVMEGNGFTWDATFSGNQTFPRSDYPTIKVDFEASDYGSWLQLLTKGQTPGGSTRALGLSLSHEGATVRNESTDIATIAGDILPDLLYTAEFVFTPAQSSVYVYLQGAPRPAAPAATYSAADWNPHLSFELLRYNVYVDNVRVHTDKPEVSSYAYDSLNRLTGVTGSASPTTSYAYDAQGSRLTRSTTSGATSYSYSPANELVTVDPPAGGDTTFIYDENGNTATRHDSSGTTSYSYDSYDRLVGADAPGGSIGFTYDGEGRRYSKHTSGTTTYYHYDVAGNILREDVVPTQGTTLVVRYVRDAAGKTLSMIEDGRTYYFIYNAHGDVTELVDESGTAVATYSYDEFGNTVRQSGTLHNPLRYAGAHNSYYDTETGLYKMGARYYDPETGRWLTRDQAAFGPRDPQENHKYAYAKNNPVSMVDPSGYKPKVLKVVAAADDAFIDHRGSIKGKVWKSALHVLIEEADNALSGTGIDLSVSDYKSWRSQPYGWRTIDGSNHYYGMEYSINDMRRALRWRNPKLYGGRKYLIGVSGVQQYVESMDLAYGYYGVAHLDYLLAFDNPGLTTGLLAHEIGHLYPWRLKDDLPAPFIPEHLLDCVMNYDNLWGQNGRSQFWGFEEKCKERIKAWSTRKF